MECNPKPASSPPPPLLWDWDAAASPGYASGPASAGKRRREGEEREAKKGMAEGGEAEARCQVEGCGLELRGAKEYHRKHRVCEAHSKCPRVVIAGQERRFCQQCSRFHALSEFDQKKRSCRRRLSDHNARRRKPQPDAFSFGSSGLPSSLFDDRGQISFVWNKAPFSHVRPFTYPSWDSLSDFKLSQVIEIGGKSTKGAATNGQVPLAKSHLSNSFSAFHHDTDELLPIKGLDASGTGSKIDGALDVRRALSLLSANSWDSTGSVQQASSLIQFTAANENSRTPPVSHGGNTTSAFWVDRQPLPPQSQVVQFTMDTSSNTFQDLEQLKPAYDSTFFSMNQIH